MQKDAAFTIAAGRPGSTHAQVGEILCNVYNRRRGPGDLRCRSAYSPGGRQQLVDMMSNKVQMAIIQSDVVAAAYSGYEQFKPNERLRVLLPLHEQVLAVIVRKNAQKIPIDVRALMSKRVAISSSNRNGEYTLRRLFDSLVSDSINISNIVAMPPAEQMAALCHDQIDVAFMILGHPNGAIQQGIHDCSAELRTFGFPALKDVIHNSKYLYMGSIPKNTYTGQSKRIVAPAVAALLMTTDQFNREAGAKFIKILLENQSILRRLHRSLSELDLDRRPAFSRNMKFFGQD